MTSFGAWLSDPPATPNGTGIAMPWNFVIIRATSAGVFIARISARSGSSGLTPRRSISASSMQAP